MAADEAGGEPAQPQANGAKLTAAQKKKLKQKQRKAAKKAERWADHTLVGATPFTPGAESLPVLQCPPGGPPRRA